MGFKGLSNAVTNTHPLLPSMGTTRQKSSCRNRLQNGPHSLLRMKVGTTRLCSKNRTQRPTRRNRGRFGRGAITTLGTNCMFTNIPGPGIRTAIFAAFGSWSGCAHKERRKPSGQRCAYARRCPEGFAAPLGCVILFLLSKLRLVCPALRAFPCVRGEGWYHYPRSVPHVHKPPRAGYQKGVLCRFWALVGGAPKKRRKPTGQRCAYARRCSEASRPRWAA